jgi:hypothetical protein
MEEARSLMGAVKVSRKISVERLFSIRSWAVESRGTSSSDVSTSMHMICDPNGFQGLSATADLHRELKDAWSSLEEQRDLMQKVLLFYCCKYHDLMKVLLIVQKSHVLHDASNSRRRLMLRSIHASCCHWWFFSHHELQLRMNALDHHFFILLTWFDS